MFKDRILIKLKSIRHKYEYVKHTAFNNSSTESVYFYTFHKCASTLFSTHVLNNAEGLFHVDYAAQISSGRKKFEKPLTFKKYGFIYGPVRVSADSRSAVGEKLVKPACEHHFIQDKIAIFFIRDPRDILISSYYSFGFTHRISDVQEVRERQQKVRESIRELTLDEYVLEMVDKQIDWFRVLYELSNACERSVVLRYEDMINDYDGFSNKLNNFVSLDDATIQEIYRRSRPKNTEDISSHRRSGGVGGFKDKLQDSTIKIVNKKLENTLALFDYES